jgi:predicted DNA-binding WGR domain protein
MATATEFSISDAFKALEDVEDDITVTPKVKEKKQIPLTESKNKNRFEVLWYEGPDEKTAEQGDPKTKEFDNSNDAVSFYKTLKNDKNKFGLWVTEREPKNWTVVRDVIAEGKSLKEEPTDILEPRFDSRKSFYGKAVVDTRDDGSQVLYSYNTPVVELSKDKKVKLLPQWNVSQTTLRHVKDFLKQNGLKAGAMKDIEKEYITNVKTPNTIAIGKNSKIDYNTLNQHEFGAPVNTDESKKSVDEGGKGSGDHRDASQRHNDMMTKMFASYDKRNDEMAKYLKTLGVSDDEIKTLKDNTGLHGNALVQKLIDLDKYHDFNQQYKFESKKTLGGTESLNEMIIDSILDRKDGEKYDPEEFYRYVRDEEDALGSKEWPISRALDSGTEDDVKNALCKYITDNEYNPKICDYVKSVNWLDESKTKTTDIKVNESEKIDLGDDKSVAKGQKIKKEKAKDEVTQVVDVDASTVDELKDSYIGNAILQCPVCKTLIYKKPEALKKSDDKDDIYNADEECPHCGNVGGFNLVGQVASLNVTPEDKKETTGAPDSKSIADSTKTDETKDEEPKEEPVDDKKQELKKPSKVESIGEAFKADGIDDVRFDKLINQYLHTVYENVDSYKTTKCAIGQDDKTIITEGTIKYKSGKEKTTKFVMEGKCMTKDGRYKLSAINETFSAKQNAFTFIASKDSSNALDISSMLYRYKTGPVNESKTIKGRAVLREKLQRK